jgi:hypothetical protein
MSIVLKLTAKKGKPVLRGFDHYWSIMMDNAVTDASFGMADIFDRSKATKTDIMGFIRRLEKGGFLTRVPMTTPVRWTVAIKQRATPKVRADGTVVVGATKQQAMWNTMRSPVSRSGFTSQDLSVWGSTDDIRIAKESAKSYIGLLAAAGYLVQLAPSGPNKLARWRLAPHMNTGPLPPMILRTKVVFDQNRHEVVGESTAEEERV